MEYMGREVFTTKQVAALFGVKISKIYHIIERHLYLFDEKQHFYRLEWSEAVKFAKEVRALKIPGVKINTSLCYLWTQEGVDLMKNVLLGKKYAKNQKNVFATIIILEEDKKYGAFFIGDKNNGEDKICHDSPIAAVIDLLS